MIWNRVTTLVVTGLLTAGLTSSAVAAPVTIYQSGFEGTDGGWVATGDWERGEPLSGPFPGSSGSGPFAGPPGAFEGNEAWGTLLDDNYSDSGSTSFLQQSFDLTGYTAAMLSWQQFVHVFYEFDTAELRVNGDLLYERTTSASTGGWQMQSVDLTPYVGGLANISFELGASAVVNRPGYYIDAVSITGEPVPEPASATLFGLGLIGFGAAVRRRRRSV